jgi:hypothetical protein
VRTSFHDDVARFGGFLSLLGRACSSHRALRREHPPLTSLSLLEFCALVPRTAHVLAKPRPTHLVSRERYEATPVRDAFTLFVTPIARRYGGNATRHMIRSHPHKLESSHTINRLRCRIARLLRVLSSSLCIAALRRAPSCSGEVHLPKSVACDRVRATRESPLFQRGIGASVESKRVEDALPRSSKRSVTALSPGSSSPGHLMVTAPGPHDVGTSYV